MIKIKAMKSKKLWSWIWDSNPQPADYKSAALPIELIQHTKLNLKLCNNLYTNFLTFKIKNFIKRKIVLFFM